MALQLMNRKYMGTLWARNLPVWLCVRNYLKILKAVIIAYPVTMVHPLISVKDATKRILHYKAMFKYITNLVSVRMFRRHDFDISTMYFNTTTFPIWTRLHFSREPSLFHGSHPAASNFVPPSNPVSFYEGLNHLGSVLRCVFPSSLYFTKFLFRCFGMMPSFRRNPVKSGTFPRTMMPKFTREPKEYFPTWFVLTGISNHKIGYG